MWLVCMAYVRRDVACMCLPRMSACLPNLTNTPGASCISGLLVGLGRDPLFVIMLQCCGLVTLGGPPNSPGFAAVLTLTDFAAKLGHCLWSV